MKAVFAIFVLYIVCINAQTTFADGKWEKVESFFGNTLPFRYGHQGAITTNGRFVLISGINDGQTFSRSVLRFDMIKLDGSLVNNQGFDVLDRVITLTTLADNDLEGRETCAVALWQDRYLVRYGGSNGGNTASGFQIYDIDNSVWLNNTIGTLPDNADKFSNHWRINTNNPSGAIDDTNNLLYLFGGETAITNAAFISSLDLNTYEFAEFPSNINFARYGSAMAFASSNAFTTGAALYILGGRKDLPAASAGVLGDVLLYSIDAQQFVGGTVTSGVSIPARANPSYAMLKNGRDLIIFGGYDIDSDTLYNDVYRLNTQTGLIEELSPVDNSGAVPAPRFLATAATMQWADEDSIMIHGGSTENGDAFNDMFKLTFSTSAFSVNNVPTPSVEDSSSDSFVIPSSSSSIPEESSSFIDVVSESSGTNLWKWI